MAVNIEDYIPVVKYQGLNTVKAANIDGVTIDTSGNTVVPGTLGVTGVATFTGTPVFSGGTSLNTASSALVGATVVLTAANSGGVFFNRSTSGSPSWTLPAATTAGLVFTFSCVNTTTGFTLTGGTFFAKADPDGAAITGTTVTHTQGTANVGDSITFVSNGTNYYSIAQMGIFAAS